MKKLLKNVMEVIAIIILIYIALTPKGIVNSVFKIDLSLYLEPIILLTVFLSSGDILGRFIEKDYIKIVEDSMYLLGLTIFLYFFINNIHIPLLSFLNSIFVYVIVVEIGFLISDVKYIMKINFLNYFINGVSILLISYAIWKILLLSTASLNPLTYDIELPFNIMIKNKVTNILKITVEWSSVCNVLFTGLVFVGIATIFSVGRDLKNKIISDISNWLYVSQLRNFLIGVGVATYFIIIRPYIIMLFSYSIYIEWGIVIFIILLIYDSFEYNIKKKYTVPFATAFSGKHEQLIEYVSDEDMDEIILLQKRFVEEGDKGPILIYMVKQLYLNGFSVYDISMMLKPLINYADKKIPLIAFRWEKYRVLKMNRMRREEILNDMVHVFLNGVEYVNKRGFRGG